MDQMAFDPPPQPGPNCRISNWRGSVSGKRNHFATAYPLENVFRSSPKADLSESAATFQLVPTKSRSTSILWYRLPPTKEPQRCNYNGLIATLRNLTTPSPNCSANGPSVCTPLRTLAVFLPSNMMERSRPLAVISMVLHLPPALGIGSTSA